MKQNYKISVAYQGLPGAYSDIASQKYFKNKMLIGQDILYFCLLMLENEGNGRIIQNNRKYANSRINNLLRSTTLFNFAKK